MGPSAGVYKKIITGVVGPPRMRWQHSHSHTLKMCKNVSFMTNVISIDALAGEWRERTLYYPLWRTSFASPFPPSLYRHPGAWAAYYLKCTRLSAMWGVVGPCALHMPWVGVGGGPRCGVGWPVVALRHVWHI